MNARSAIDIDLECEELARTVTTSARWTIQTDPPTMTDLPVQSADEQMDFCVEVLDTLRKAQRDLGWCPEEFAKIRRLCHAKILEQEGGHGAG